MRPSDPMRVSAPEVDALADDEALRCQLEEKLSDAEHEGDGQQADHATGAERG